MKILLLGRQADKDDPVKGFDKTEDSFQTQTYKWSYSEEA